MTVAEATSSAIDSVTTRARAIELRDEHEQALFRTNDHRFAGLLVAQWVIAMIVACVATPRAWVGLSSEVHSHVLLAFLLGGWLVVPPVWLAVASPGSATTRFAIAAGQMGFGALLIHLSGGRIETHFHVFGSLAILACYRDYRVIVVATLLVVVDHVVRGAMFPESIYGIATVEPSRWVEHAMWVAFEDLFLIATCLRAQREMWGIAERHAKLEAHLEVERDMSEAREANRVKSEFIANMSHEIRTPMTAILGYADLLLDAKTTAEERRTHIQTIRRNGDHLLSILNDVLDISKIEAGRMTFEAVPCSPSAIIGDVASTMRVRAKEKGLSLDVQYATAIPETIESDPTRLRQVLVNLVSNAVKFTGRGGVRIVVRCQELSAGGTLTFEIVDTGIGMSDSQMTRVFEPFVQADSSTTRNFGGTGLGLAICRRLSLMLGGDLVVESQPGHGSTFRLTIRTGMLAGVRMFERWEEAGDSIQPPEANPEEQSHGRLACHVLLVEDGPDNQLLVATHLRRAGARVTIVENGRLALERATASWRGGVPFDVILMDMQMPEMDGYEATRALRACGYDWPVVALTAHAMAGDRLKCLAAGCCGYLTKPVSRQGLIAAVAAAVQKKGASASASGDRESGGIFSEMADDPEMKDIVGLFVDSLARNSVALEAALGDGDRDTVKRLAHQIKGAAGGYGFPSITVAAARLEVLAKGQGPIDEAVRELCAMCRKVRVVRGAA